MRNSPQSNRSRLSCYVFYELDYRDVPCGWQTGTFNRIAHCRCELLQMPWRCRRMCVGYNPCLSCGSHASTLCPTEENHIDLLPSGYCISFDSMSCQHRQLLSPNYAIFLPSLIVWAQYSHMRHRLTRLWLTRRNWRTINHLPSFSIFNHTDPPIWVLILISWSPMQL